MGVRIQYFGFACYTYYFWNELSGRKLSSPWAQQEHWLVTLTWRPISTGTEAKNSRRQHGPRCLFCFHGSLHTISFRLKVESLRNSSIQLESDYAFWYLVPILIFKILQLLQLLFHLDCFVLPKGNVHPLVLWLLNIYCARHWGRWQGHGRKKHMRSLGPWDFRLVTTKLRSVCGSKLMTFPTCIFFFHMYRFLKVKCWFI